MTKYADFSITLGASFAISSDSVLLPRAVEESIKTMTHLRGGERIDVHCQGMSENAGNIFARAIMG